MKPVFVLLWLLFWSVAAEQPRCKILSLSGGGSHGAFEAGVLQSIVEKSDPGWNVFAGVSAGSLNAAVLGAREPIHRSVEKLKKVYSELRNEDIYKYNWPFTQSIYDTSPLRETISKFLETGTNRYPTWIGLTNFTSGFFRMADLSWYNQTDQVDILMASTAIPVAFPPVHWHGTYFVDGGLSSNSIIYPMIDYCISMGYDPDNIVIDHISSYNPYIQNPLPDNLSIGTITSRLFQMIKDNFDNMVAKVAFCEESRQVPIAKIRLWYPELPIPYGPLDFTHGKEIMESAKMNYRMEEKSLC